VIILKQEHTTIIKINLLLKVVYYLVMRKLMNLKVYLDSFQVNHNKKYKVKIKYK
jgi:hypothetical protein